MADNSYPDAPVEPEPESLSDWEGGKAVTDQVRRQTFYFAEPTVGTPAYDALLANRAHTVTYTDKHVLRHVKRVKKKHLLGSHKKDKHRDRVNIKGKMIDGQHEQYILTMGMMMGIRVSVARALAASNQPLLVRDFGKVDKLVFPPGGCRKKGRMTPPHQLNHTFKFKDYAPRAFAAVREMYGVDSASYMNSVCGDFNFIQFIANSRSGQFFFYSHDGKYMIKTQTKEENKFLRRILPHYFRHMAKNPDSMVCQFYGMHRVKMYHLRRKLHFVVMRSVVDTACKIHTMYDLKGSLVGRQASHKDRETGGVLKDQDLLSDGMKFHLGERRGHLFCKVAAADAAFLSELKIMDYSLLVGIHDRSRRDQDEADWLAKNSTGAMIEAADAAAESDVKAGSGDKKADRSSSDGAHENKSLLPLPPPTDKESQAAAAAAAGGESAQDSQQSPGGDDAESDSPTHPLELLKRSHSMPDTGGPEGGTGGEGGGGGGTGAAQPPHKVNGHWRPHSDTPLVRAKADRAHLPVPRDPLTQGDANGNGGSTGRERVSSLPAAPSGPLHALTLSKPTAAAGGDTAATAASGNGAAVAAAAAEDAGSNSEEVEEWIAAQRRRSANATTSEEDEDSDDDSSDSEEEDGEFDGEAFSSGWADGMMGKKKDGSGGLPPRPLGEPDDVVEVPHHRKTDDHHAASLAAGGGGGRDSLRGSIASPEGGSSAADFRLATRRDGGMGSRNSDGTKGDKIYFVGIIDILQQYTRVKRAETFMKSFTHNVDEISCVPPDKYAARFANFLKDATDLAPSTAAASSSDHGSNATSSPWSDAGNNNSSSSSNHKAASESNNSSATSSSLSEKAP